MRHSKIITFLKLAVDKFLSKTAWYICHRRLILVTQYQVLSFYQSVKQLGDWLYVIANLEMFSFVLLNLSFAEWTAVADYIIWNPALVPALILQFVSAGDMLDLLKWRTHPDKIAGCLSKLKEIDGSEIVKVYTTIFFLPLFCF